MSIRKVSETGMDEVTCRVCDREEILGCWKSYFGLYAMEAFCIFNESRDTGEDKL